MLCEEPAVIFSTYIPVLCYLQLFSLVALVNECSLNFNIARDFMQVTVTEKNCSGPYFVLPSLLCRVQGSS